MLENTISELKKFFVKLLKEHSASADKSKRLIKEFEKRITSIEQKIDALLEGYDTLSNQHKLLCSIDGEGWRI